MTEVFKNNPGYTGSVKNLQELEKIFFNDMAFFSSPLIYMTKVFKIICLRVIFYCKKLMLTYEVFPGLVDQWHILVPIFTNGKTLHLRATCVACRINFNQKIRMQ